MVKMNNIQLKAKNKHRRITGRIRRIDTFIAMFFTVFFTGLIYYEPQLIGWYNITEGDFSLAAPLFDLDRLDHFMPMIILLAIFQFIILNIKMLTGRWTFLIAFLNTIYNSANCVLFWKMLTDDSLFNVEFIKNFTELLNFAFNQMTKLWSIGTTMVLVLVIFGSIVDILMGFIKASLKN
jgi:hypothetical protein